MTDLIMEANRLLAIGSTGPRESVRGACWLARAALEDAVRFRLESRGLSTGAASMRALLGCLEVSFSDDPAVSRAANHAWIGLSNASHHHAYELAPTVSEVRHLITLVGVVSAKPCCSPISLTNTPTTELG